MGSQAGSASCHCRRDLASGECDIVDTPPHPQFFAGPDHSLWSSTNQEPASDSDVAPAPSTLAGCGSGHRMSVKGDPIDRVQMCLVTQPMLPTRSHFSRARTSCVHRQNYQIKLKACECAYKSCHCCEG